jgi:hypothetical protein
MATMTKTKAQVTIEHPDWDYSLFYDLTAVNEESALVIAKEATENDLRPNEVQSVTVEVFENREQIATFKFDRHDLEA